MDGQVTKGSPTVAPPPRDATAIVQDHIVQRGGGERVLLSMARALPGAPIHTSFYWPESTYAEFADLDIRPAGVDRVRLLRQRHRTALPILPTVFARMHLDQPVVVCGSSGWAAGAQTSGRKVVYFHSLARWLHETDSYLVGLGRPARLGLQVLDPRLRRWDQRAVESADRLFVYSSAMQTHVKRVYARTAEILPPPVVVDARGPEESVGGLAPGFHLCPCRLMAYKNIDVLLDAFRQMPGRRLVVAGDGLDAARLHALAPPNVHFAGAVGDAGMRWLYRNAAAVVSAAFEPFGLITLEANAFGTRSVVLRDGGFEDTVVDGVTGVFFDTPDTAAIIDAIDRIDQLPSPDAEVLRAHTSQWAEHAFVNRMRTVVHEELAAR